ncbi:MAG: hypothetical protein A2506_04270 [Elusimicrobia bacterium RIFOXYD12_FULL_66_9]|nr:MAG: hypothetical protein A2506_04270 [Elusimicrobia bacterium RIFOXYD12_FULL_66_9]
MKAPSYRVVLVGPENPLNVGFVARAMHCFGVCELVVAASAWESMPAEAHVTGACAAQILQKARFTPTLAAALRGCETAVAFSRRPTVLEQSEFSLPSAPSDLPRAGRVALVFGRESKGLTRAESALCPYLARIPCREGVSLNLGQAAAVALFSTPASSPEKTPSGSSQPVSLDRMLALWDFLEPRLAAAPRFTEGRIQRIRQMLYRLSLRDADFDLLFAVMNELARPAASRRGAKLL